MSITNPEHEYNEDLIFDQLSHFYSKNLYLIFFAGDFCFLSGVNERQNSNWFVSFILLEINKI